MRAYVACHSINIANETATVLRNHGVTVDCRWLLSNFQPTEVYSEESRARIARECAEDVLAADALVLVAGLDKYSGGKFVEAGVALGTGRRVFVIGRRENMLMWHPSIEQFDTADALAMFLLWGGADAKR